MRVWKLFNMQHWSQVPLTFFTTKLSLLPSYLHVTELLSHFKKLQSSHVTQGQSCQLAGPRNESWGLHKWAEYILLHFFSTSSTGTTRGTRGCSGGPLPPRTKHNSGRETWLIGQNSEAWLSALKSSLVHLEAAIPIPMKMVQEPAQVPCWPRGITEIT